MALDVGRGSTAEGKFEASASNANFAAKSPEIAEKPHFPLRFSPRTVRVFRAISAVRRFYCAQPPNEVFGASVFYCALATAALPSASAFFASLIPD